MRDNSEVIVTDLLSVHGPNPARHVPFAAVLGAHGDAVIFTRQYPAVYVPDDTTIGRLYNKYVWKKTDKIRVKFTTELRYRQVCVMLCNNNTNGTRTRQKQTVIVSISTFLIKAIYFFLPRVKRAKREIPDRTTNDKRQNWLLRGACGKRFFGVPIRGVKREVRKNGCRWVRGL